MQSLHAPLEAAPPSKVENGETSEESGFRGWPIPVSPGSREALSFD